METHLRDMLKDHATSTPLLVSPADIQLELSKIWDSLEGTNKTRACLFNLIFYTEKGSRIDYINKVAQSVVEKFPARIIMITVDRDNPQSFLNARVSVLLVTKGDQSIACDLIHLDVAGDQFKRVPFVVLPHIVPDLPVYLIWAKDLTCEHAFLDQLEKFADRLIVDSEASENFSLFAQNCLQRKGRNHVDIADLNWARTETWRDLLSNAFYSPEKLNFLKEAKQIQITYNASKSLFFCHTAVQSVYLQAWIASQLQWSYLDFSKNGDVHVFSYKNDQNPIQILLTPCFHDSFNAGMIVSLDISTYSDHHFSFHRNLEQPHEISLISSSKDQCDIPAHFIFAKSELGMSLVREICHKGTSLHFLNALQLIAKINFFCD